MQLVACQSVQLKTHYHPLRLLLELNSHKAAEQQGGEWNYCCLSRDAYSGSWLLHLAKSSGYPLGLAVTRHFRSLATYLWVEYEQRSQSWYGCLVQDMRPTSECAAVNESRLLEWLCHLGQFTRVVSSSSEKLLTLLRENTSINVSNLILVNLEQNALPHLQTSVGLCTLEQLTRRIRLRCFCLAVAMGVVSLVALVISQIELTKSTPEIELDDAGITAISKPNASELLLVVYQQRALLESSLPLRFDTVSESQAFYDMYFSDIQDIHVDSRLLPILSELDQWLCASILLDITKSAWTIDDLSFHWQGSILHIRWTEVVYTAVYWLAHLLAPWSFANIDKMHLQKSPSGLLSMNIEIDGERVAEHCE